jgi:hypothetical protein
MRTLLTSLLFLCFVTVLSAQMSLGVRAGYGQSNVRSGSDLDLITDQFSSTATFSIGLTTDIQLSDVVSLRSGLEINRRGASLELSEDVSVFGFDLPFGARAQTRFTYVEVPVLAQWHFPTSSSLQPYVFGGASIGYAVGGNIRTTARAIIEFNLMTTPLDLEGINYQRFHLAAHGGAGVKATLDNGMAVFAEARYEHGFSQPSDVPLVAVRVGFRGINLGAGVSFSLN